MFHHPKHFQLGKILRSHGLKGELVCSLDTDVPEAYAKLKGFFLEINHTLLPYFVKSIKINGNEALISLEDVTTSEQANRLKGADIYLPLEKLPKIAKDEFYWHDLLGAELIDEELGLLGTIDDVIETSGHNLLSFNYQGKEVLFPFVKEFVKDFDLKTKKVEIKLPEGLLDIYLATAVEKDDDLEGEEVES